MKNILLGAEIIVSALLIGLILLQSKGSGLSTVFGGSGTFYRSKKGFEKIAVVFTIILASVFLILSVLSVIIY